MFTKSQLAPIFFTDCLNMFTPILKLLFCFYISFHPSKPLKIQIRWHRWLCYGSCANVRYSVYVVYSRRQDPIPELLNWSGGKKVAQIENCIFELFVMIIYFSMATEIDFSGRAGMTVVLLDCGYLYICIYDVFFLFHTLWILCLASHDFYHTNKP